MVLFVADHAGNDWRRVERREAGRGDRVKADIRSAPIVHREHMRAGAKTVQ